MIHSFADAETARVWNGEHAHTIPVGIQRLARQRLKLLDIAGDFSELLDDDRLKLELVRNSKKHNCSVRLSASWCIRFRWEYDACRNVEIVNHDPGD